MASAYIHHRCQCRKLDFFVFVRYDIYRICRKNWTFLRISDRPGHSPLPKNLRNCFFFSRYTCISSCNCLCLCLCLLLLLPIILAHIIKQYQTDPVNHLCQRNLGIGFSFPDIYRRAIIVRLPNDYMLFTLNHIFCRQRRTDAM